jgi:hypothetical protein
LILQLVTIILTGFLLFASTTLSFQHSAHAFHLYDNFEGNTYTLTDNQTSPNGKWINIYSGFGTYGTEKLKSSSSSSSFTQLNNNNNNNTVFYEKPKTSKNSNETYSALTLTTETYEDVEIYVKVRTNQQLRENSPLNPWEAAWIMWRYQDDWHHYYFIFKPNGIELGKKQNENHTDEQLFLYTANEPKLKIGEWSTWYIKMSGNHIEIWLKLVDGSWQRVVNYYDDVPIVGSGNIGLYTEDAYVQFDDVYISSLIR